MEEAEREKDERDEGKSRKAGKGMRSLAARAFASANTFTHLVRSLIIFPVAAEGKVAAAQMLARGELKVIVIPCRHTVLSLSNLLQYYTWLRRRRRRRRRRRENDSVERERRYVDQQQVQRRLNRETSMPAQS